MLAQGNLASLHVEALTESLCQPTLLLLMGCDKVTAHAAWLQMNALRRELAGLPLFRQTLLHVTFGTRAFFLAIAAPKQGSQTLLSYICLFITLNGLGKTQIAWRIPCVGTSMLHQLHGYLQGLWYCSSAALYRLIKQRGGALCGIDTESITYTRWM